jgi:tight adherence protein B
MTDPATFMLIAPLLAGISAAAFICAAFFPWISRPLAGRRSAVFQALLKGRNAGLVPATRTVRRAQEAALKSVAQQGRAQRVSAIEARIAAAGLDWTPRFYILLCCIFGSLVFRITTLAGISPSTALAVAAIAAWFMPLHYLAHRARRRRVAFLAAFSNAVDMMVRGVKSGLSVTDCLSMVASDAASPVREEFEAIVAQLRAGLPLSAAVEKLGAAMPAPEVRFFVMIMSAQSQSGGNLSDALINLSGVLRDREKIAMRIRISSAEGRASALIIGALPFSVIGATAAFAPDYIAVLWNDDAGRRVAAFCAFWLMAGMIVLARMARIEV